MTWFLLTIAVAFAVAYALALWWPLAVISATFALIVIDRGAVETRTERRKTL